MRILKPGEPCPCCGRPLREGLSREKILLLSYLAEGKTILEIAGMFEEEKKMTLIALVDSKWGIAKDGKQICHIPDDLRRFRELTMGGTVIMGRKTYEAIGGPLDNRRNVIISKTMPRTPGVEIVRNLRCVNGAFVIGGESVYRQLLPYCDRAYITMLDADLGADQFAPDLDADEDWRLVAHEASKHYGGLTYRYLTYERCLRWRG